VWRAALIAAAAAALAGCGGGDRVEGPPPAAPASITLRSPAFADGAAIPERYSCDGAGVSPPLRWNGVPAGARSLALLMEDPDAPGGTFVHWTLYGVAPDARGLAEGKAPAGARQGENSFGDSAYGGPCPPQGKGAHRYVFTLYALRDTALPNAGASPEDVRAAIAGHALARGTLTGRFAR
jgi:Raf kinase inhibitor-like YbhB/YbcL family protein